MKIYDKTIKLEDTERVYGTMTVYGYVFTVIGHENYPDYVTEFLTNMGIPPNSLLMHTVSEKKPGYHLTEIQKQEYGSAGKIMEECREFIDANAQKIKIMELIELSDLIGAIRGYLSAVHPSTSLEDLIQMSNVTERAFKNGHR